MSNLDPEGKLSIIQAIDNIRNEYDITIIVVEHNPEVMQKYADKVLAINNGQDDCLRNHRRRFTPRANCLRKTGFTPQT